MHFQVKMPENGGKNICRDKQIPKSAALKFLDVKVISEI